ncbi:hypothetical protein NPS01_15460 [Nocardioides psychrotolerans]|uniref:hypothetical protein n=1 Tax=Nocardioides psychrotolerans TaxID=1005945 RepID=UPI001195A8B4|nr:hypothetical protein [Nocardioides psychrotolerans]GEP37883.1 hypothetical protein NPS01_15460 [Nocardioides psychrotolerans]
MGVTDEPDVPTGEPGRRTEYWADLAVDVPADWGWGSTPPACGPGPSRTADGRRVVRFDEAVPYVGRPLAQTDMCVDPPSPPSAPYVWLGADVDPGTIDLGDGWSQETVEVNGSMLTVATDDAELREHILSTARGGEVCLSEVELRGTLDHAGGVNPSREPTTLRVCVYRREDASDTTPELAYAAELGPVALAACRRAMSEVAPPRDQCPTLDILEVEWVVLEQVADDGTVSDRDVVHMVCPGIDRDAGGLSGFETSPLTPAMTFPWAVGGIPAVVYGSSISVAGFADYFIGGLG